MNQYEDLGNICCLVEQEVEIDVNSCFYSLLEIAKIEIFEKWSKSDFFRISIGIWDLVVLERLLVSPGMQIFLFFNKFLAEIHKAGLSFSITVGTANMLLVSFFVLCSLPLSMGSW